MAKRDAGYSLKSPRGRTQGLAARAIDLVEDGIYIVVAILLLGAAAFALWSTISTLITDVQQLGAAKNPDPVTIVTDILDKGLILFIIAELLHTVRVTLNERALVAEPFLIVGLIAGVRRLLILTAQATQSPNAFRWNPQGIELLLLIVLIMVMTLAVLLWRRLYVPDGKEA